ncbi:DUF6261 family protein [Parabacteroides sp. GYB001]|uniref:DUF6261 family protein n=1 Tax=Parabacteroides leei TaxID=2939491 RepID=UPI002016B3D9|nr:DUF6261 family protein [Parabacteroides leei]MCL3853963.1 DUF6261 family protein [Parabacteroides leei]
MAKIQTFPKSQLRNGEFLDAAKSIIQKMNDTDGVIEPVKSFFDVFNTCTDEYANSIVKRCINEYTAEAKRLKNENLNNRSVIFRVVDGYKKSRIDEKRRAAISVDAGTSGFRKCRNLSIENLIQDTELFINLLETDIYKGKVTTLGLTDQLASLKVINKESADVVINKILASRRYKRPRKPELTRAELAKAYDELVDELNSYTRRNGNDKYFELFSWWNAMIDEYRIKLSDRYGKNAGGKLDGGKSNTPFPGSGGNEDDRPVIE